MPRARTRAGNSQSKTDILQKVEKEKVKFMRLQFTDIMGTIKNVEIPDRQFEEALNGEIMFDGSSIEGFVRIEESDMYLRPDLSTFNIFPWAGPSGRKSRAHHLRHLHARGHALRGLPADDPEEGHRVGCRKGLLDERGP